MMQVQMTLFVYMMIKPTFLPHVTRYEKRDRLGYFIDSLFLVWIVSAVSISVESNGASFVKKEVS